MSAVRLYARLSLASLDQERTERTERTERMERMERGMWGLQRSRYADCNGSEASTEPEVVVNIGGVRHVLLGDALSQFPETRLAELLRCSQSAPAAQDQILGLCDDYDPDTGEFYFDRDPDAFRCITELFFYGEIHMKRGTCPMCFLKELEFWRVGAERLDACCRGHLREVQDELEEIAEKVRTLLVDRDGDPEAAGWARAQAALWRLAEKPESSLPAHVLAIVSFVFILVSSVVMCVGTVPELQVEDAEGRRSEHPALELLETVCITWFTLEYVLRLVAAPQKLRFVLGFMNIIDVMAILPFYVVLVLSSLGAGLMELENVQQAVQALRIMRIARIFKLARHSSGLQTLTSALKSSFKELGLLLMYMGVGVFLFSALGYTMEQNHPDTLFTSIPQSFWWAVITMTTVGYGDVYPKTTLGRCNAAISFLCGVIAIALPIHPIINNFVLFYNKQQVLETAAKHEIELMALRESQGELLDSESQGELLGESQGELLDEGHSGEGHCDEDQGEGHKCGGDGEVQSEGKCSAHSQACCSGEDHTEGKSLSGEGRGGEGRGGEGRGGEGRGGEVVCGAHSCGASVMCGAGPSCHSDLFPSRGEPGGAGIEVKDVSSS